MPQPRKFFAPLLCLLGLATGAQADDSAYRIALDKELANRAVARQVVPQLAERHSGTAQGEFWQAYANLEARQQTRYADEAKRQGLANEHSGGFKAHASLAFAKLFNAAFINMLAGATQDYLKELEALPAQSNADDQAFWQYVIEQERAQVDALALAAEKDFKGAAAVLETFTGKLIQSE
ncbi:hypothetical protein ACNJYG_11515 [Pseudomonas sp. GW6]